MNCLNKKLFFIIFSIILEFNIIFSQINFGSYQYEKILEVKNETLLTSKILIWNSGKNDIEVVFEIIEKPKNVEVYLDKKEIILSSELKNDYEILIINNREIKVLPVNVYFYILSKDASGYVKIRAYAKSLENAEIPIRQEREFLFIINKVEDSKKEKVETKLTEKIIESISNSIRENHTNILPVIIIVISVLASLIILKRKGSEWFT